MTLCLTNAKLKEKLVSPLLTYYNKNKHSWLYHLLGIGLRLYCTKEKPRARRGEKSRLFSDFFQSINKNLITGIGAQNSYFIVGSYPIKEGL